MIFDRLITFTTDSVGTSAMKKDSKGKIGPSTVMNYKDSTHYLIQKFYFKLVSITKEEKEKHYSVTFKGQLLKALLA